MVQAKTETKERARALRRAGRAYDEIVAELGMSKSSVSLWVRDLPRPRRAEHARAMAEARWEPYRREREVLRRQVRATAANEIGLYWAEGTKSKPYRLDERVIFVNSDPGMIALYLRWLVLLEVEPERLRFRVMIHESADVEEAERYWADLVGVDVTALEGTALKKHNPVTVRKNTGEAYHGCLTVRVLGSADLYRRIEGRWYGIVVEASSDSRERCPN